MTPVPGEPLDRDNALEMLTAISKALLLKLATFDPDTYGKGIRLLERDLEKGLNQRVGVHPEIDPTFGYCVVLTLEEGEPPDVPTYVERSS